MFYDPRQDPHGLPHDPFLALVSPRPIGWISTISADGVLNLAPYSYFNAVSSRPPVVAFSSSGIKHSMTNAEATGSFVANIVGADLIEAMNLSSAAVDAGVDEFKLAGLTAVASRNVDAPRVGEALAALECLTMQVIPIKPTGDRPATSYLVLGEVVGIHINEAILTAGRIDMAKLRPVARLGYMDYAVVDSVFELLRPSAADVSDRLERGNSP